MDYNTTAEAEKVIHGLKEGEVSYSLISNCLSTMCLSRINVGEFYVTNLSWWVIYSKSECKAVKYKDITICN